VSAVAWSPDGKRIASASREMQVWNAVNGRKIITYQGHSNSVYAVAWSPDGKHIASASADKTVQVWEAS
jgi:WD40 repeat protein